MRGRILHIMSALAVAALTFIAPDGSLLSPVDAVRIGSQAGAESLASPDVHDVPPISGVAGGLAPAGQAAESQGTVTVTATVLDQAPPPPPSGVPSQPVWRFYNRVTDTHFYTYSEAERLNVIATWPGMFRFEGYAYSTNPGTDTVTLHRFYNLRTRTHFYTASEEEKATVLRNWPTIYRYEGPAYGVSTVYSPGKRTVYRFFNLRSGTHFYTATEEEKNHIIATFPTYRYEGIAFYVGP